MVIIGNGYRVLVGDVRERLKDIASESVQCVCSSPPYWNLRDYGTALWDGGDAGCDHVELRGGVGAASAKQVTSAGASTTYQFRDVCGKCGARRVDSQLGLEPVPDCGGWITKQPCGECYVCHMVEVFREVRRVLRPDGVCLLNLGDSYASSPPGNTTRGVSGASTLNGVNGKSGRYRDTLAAGTQTKRSTIVSGLKPKDLCMIPARVALALQADGWWLRQDIIWAKPNPMPESVTDRCTKAHEYVFLLTKSAKYFWDAEAVKEAGAEPNRQRNDRIGGATGHTVRHSVGALMGASATRNRRSVWTIATQSFSEAHFATWPPELVKPMLLAGTSAMGCCATCRAPRERVVERTQLKRERPNEYTKRTGEDGTGNSCANDVAGVDVKTIGWQATCDCNADTIPCLVLDPFSGSGTTGMVATELGREYVGCELNPAYAEMSRRRITSWKRRDADKQLEPLPGQRSLFGDD